MKTAPTNKKVRELIQMVKEGKLIPRPDFQRRLVWSRADKNHFIDSIIRGYPFPEIYLADGDVDLEKGTGTQQLVDGLQRVTTLIQYFEGDTDLKLTTVPPYRDLDEDDKRAFLQYDVAVRDLGNVQREEIIEVFKRINATKYSLLEIEVNNAVYAGALKQFADRLAADAFFEEHSVFHAADLKRMGDLRYALGIVITMLGGYTNRDDSFGEFLDRYNDDFPEQGEIKDRIDKVLAFVQECGFHKSSRVWRKADLFTLLVEMDHLLNVQTASLNPSTVVDAISKFYESIDTDSVDGGSIQGIYYKAALQASNDRINRVRRGAIIGGKIFGKTDAEIVNTLKFSNLI
jgi:hypothetical protein